MKTTINLGLKKPEGTDVVDVADFNANADILDNEVVKKASTSADGRMSKEDKAKLDASTSIVTASTLILRDGSGRAKVAAPSASDDIARKDTVDVVQSSLTSHTVLGGTAHGATSAATASTLISRDTSGRAKVAAPSASDDIARKDTVDFHANRADNPHATTAAQVGAIPSTTQTATGDWNNYKTTGFYTGNSLANSPTGPGSNTWKYMQVIKHTDAYVQQIAYDFNGKGIWVRTLINGVWSAWSNIGGMKVAAGGLEYDNVPYGTTNYNVELGFTPIIAWITASEWPKVRYGSDNFSVIKLGPGFLTEVETTNTELQHATSLGLYRRPDINTGAAWNVGGDIETDEFGGWVLDFTDATESYFLAVDVYPNATKSGLRFEIYKDNGMSIGQGFNLWFMCLGY